MFKRLLNLKILEEDIKKKYLEQGLSEQEATARAEMEAYNKEKFKISSTKLKGETPKQNIVVKISFESMEEANLFVSNFHIDKQSMSIDGKEVMEFFRKCNLKKFGG